MQVMYNKPKISIVAVFVLFIILSIGCTNRETNEFRDDRQWNNEINALLQEIGAVSSQSIPFEVIAGPINGDGQSIQVNFRFVTPEEVVIDAQYATGDIENTFEMKQYHSIEPYWNVFTAQERDEGYAVLRQPLISPSRATQIARATLGLSTPFTEGSHGGLVLRWGKETQSTFNTAAIWSFLYLERGDNNSVVSHRVIINAQDGSIIEINRDW